MLACQRHPGNMLGTSDAWSTSHLSQLTSEPAYYIVDSQIHSDEYFHHHVYFFIAMFIWFSRDWFCSLPRMLACQRHPGNMEVIFEGDGWCSPLSTEGLSIKDIGTFRVFFVEFFLRFSVALPKKSNGSPHTTFSFHYWTLRAHPLSIMKWCYGVV